MNWTHVLVATDFGEAGNRAVQSAAGIAAACRAQLTVVHVRAVAPEPNPMLGRYVATQSPEERAAEQDRLRDEIHRLVPAGVTADVRIDVGDDTAHRVVELADGAGADLVVVGTHGRKGVSRFVLGSVAEHVVRAAHCAVLVVR